MSKIWLLISSLFLDPTEIPDPLVTPGLVACTSVEEVCGYQDGLSYSKRHRVDSYSLRKEIRDRDHCDTHNSEVDHLVPLSLGGADVKENLWCQPGSGTWSFRDKDRLELWMHDQVCKRHTFPLVEAQKLFVGDWRKSYCKFFTDPRCDR